MTCSLQLHLSQTLKEETLSPLFLATMRASQQLALDSVGPQVQQEPAEQDLPQRHPGGQLQLQPSALLEHGLPDGGAQLPDPGWVSWPTCTRSSSVSSSLFPSLYLCPDLKVKKCNAFAVS